MKKKLYFLIGSIIFFILIVFVTIEEKTDNKSSISKIRVGEVTHSVFYAPFYVAINEGYFKEQGIEIDLSVISGANNVTSAVLSGDIDIGFCGPEATIYIYNGGEKNYIQSFAGLTKRDGQFIVSRKKQDNFNWNMLKGKEVLAGRIAGMPELNFENALNNTKINKKDVKINTSVDFSSLISAFISGTGDYVNLFEPNATKLENMKYGYIVDSIGQKSGEMPYTAFNARKDYINKNKELLIKFTGAINKGLEFVRKNDEKIIAKSIKDQFNDIDTNTLEKIIKRYKSSDVWLENPYIEKKLFQNLVNLMMESNQLKNTVDYDKLIINMYKK